MWKMLLFIWFAAAASLAGAMPTALSDESEVTGNTTETASQWQEKFDQRLYETSRRLAEISSLLADETRPDTERETLKKEWEKLSKLRLVLTRSRNLLDSCRDDSCRETIGKIFEKIARVSDSMFSRPILEPEPEPEKPQPVEKASLSDEKKPTVATNQGDPLDALQRILTLAELTQASSLQTGARIGGIDIGGGAPPSPNATGVATSDQMSSTGETPPPDTRLPYYGEITIPPTDSIQPEPITEPITQPIVISGQ